MSCGKSERESCDISQTLGNSQSFGKKFKLELDLITETLTNTLAVLLLRPFNIITGSRAEGTNINSEDYGSLTPVYISDMDIMSVFTPARVIDEGNPLPEVFDSHLYCKAERGEHTTDGFRKLRIIHRPVYHSADYYSCKVERKLSKSVEHRYVSSSKFTSNLMTDLGPAKNARYFGTQGPSLVVEHDNSLDDWVKCLYVKTWPQEAESWFTRQTHWPDKKLKSQIRKIGYLLVPTGNSYSLESDLEWRCSFSIAEKILFQSLSNFQRNTFVMLKALLKEYVPSEINTDGEKKFLTTYHIKTLFLWSLEDRKLQWEPKHMLDIIGHMLDELSIWINKKYLPHYFIPSVNLFDDRRLHGRENSFICSISAIRNKLLNQIKQSQFFMAQEMQMAFGSIELPDDKFVISMHHLIMQYITGELQNAMHLEVLEQIIWEELNFCHSALIQGINNRKPEVDPDSQHFYSTLYSDPVHEKLLTEVFPGLIDQYCGCIHLAEYCMAARDGRVLPGVLHTAESLLKDTLHFDPCSGHVKLACLYIAMGDFDKAMDRLCEAENNFHVYKRMVSQHVKVKRTSTGIFSEITHELGCWEDRFKHYSDMARVYYCTRLSSICGRLSAS